MRLLHRCRFALSLVAAGFGVAAAADPLQSPACSQAMQSLQAAEREAPRSAGGGIPPPALQAARRAAARACLGTEPDEERPAQAPQVVAPVQVPPAASMPLPPPIDAARSTRSTVPLPPIPQNRPPPIITSCDLTGCWASDGTRLNRAGPNLLFGPRGFCQQNGAVTSCP